MSSPFRVAVSLTLGLCACRGGSDTAAAVRPGVSWPAADGAVRTSTTWRGGDAAYSVPLPDGRVLWLFGDSFVGAGDGTSGRAGRAMIRNSVAVQSTTDPATATWTFHWNASGTAAAPFFSGTADTWLWPGPATASDQGLLLMFAQVTASTQGLGFETIGSTALRVHDPSGPPTDWTFDPVALPPAPPGVQLGLGAHLRDGGFLYAFAPVEPGTHDVFVGRWELEADPLVDLRSIQWWTGAAWSPDPTAARAVTHDVQTEFSVSRVGPEFWMISTEGFGAVDVVVRTAAAPVGPWSAPRPLYRPPEFGRSDVLVYSAKAHPHLKGAPVVLTYNTNRTDFWDLAADLDVYFPRFVKVTP